MTAPILVHGATGFTGGLVCDLLASRGMTYAISGRSRERLERVRDHLARGGGAPPVELCAIDVTRGHLLREAISGRKIVLACAGPFTEIGAPVVAACAELGVHYVDTTGEQGFVRDMVARHGDAATKSGACIVPAMAYEIAPADWACHVATARVGGSPDTLDVFYSSRPVDGSRGNATTRGTKKSMLRVLADRAPMQFVDGALVRELSAEKTTSFALPNGRRLAAVSFPSPEAVVVPQHTGARTVRTYMAMGERTAATLHRMRKLAPSLVRMTRALSDRLVDRTSNGPEGDARAATFAIVVEATKGGERSRVAVTGRDPYGLTAELQVYAAERAMIGAITARGIIGPSVAFSPREAILALGHTGLLLLEPA